MVKGFEVSPIKLSIHSYLSTIPSHPYISLHPDAAVIGDLGPIRLGLHFAPACQPSSNEAQLRQSPSLPGIVGGILHASRAGEVWFARVKVRRGESVRRKLGNRKIVKWTPGNSGPPYHLSNVLCRECMRVPVIMDLMPSLWQSVQHYGLSCTATSQPQHT